MTAVLSLGSNLGDSLGRLRAALEVLQPHAVSSVWETEPVGGVEQEDFLNIVVLCEADATEAWARAQRAEHEAARERTVRWGPRTLDVDVVLAAPPVPAGLVVPHPRAHERAFVLAPWLEVQPDAVLPGHGPVAALLAALDGGGVVRRTDLVLR
ncbi:MAG: 2-amino-4-hydroxy-6-hydroxymethyldihydropteridine diphosphokinase [Frankiales bacterium]|nr:2-amino-4-hydroxy-6-hydroxymethyldihydropteridine diphosphokinase [Frankiales bacterium]